MDGPLCGFIHLVPGMFEFEIAKKHTEIDDPQTIGGKSLEPVRKTEIYPFV